MFFGFVLVVLHRFSTAGLQDIFALEFGLGSAGFAFLSSSYFYLYPLMQVPAGFALDLWGPRKVAGASFLIMTLGSLLFAFAASFNALFWGRVLISFGAAFIWGSLLKIQGLYFSGRIFALLTGFGAVAGSFGVILAGSPFMAGVLYCGWRVTFIIIAGFSFMLMIGNIVFTGARSGFAKNAGKKTLAPGSKPDLAAAFEVLKHRSGWLLFLCHFGIYGSYAAFIGIWGFPLLIWAGCSGAEASFFITWIGISYMLGGPLLGFLSDRINQKRRPVLMLSCAALALGMAVLLLLPYLGSYKFILLYSALGSIGFFTPALILTMVLSRELEDPALSGVAVGVANSGGFVGAAFAQIVTGLILAGGHLGQNVRGISEYCWSAFQLAVAFSVLLLGVAFIAAYIVREDDQYKKMRP